MDQIIIGKFIAEERKRKGYTQKQLSEKLGISDKTISKWECGNGFLEVSLLLPLCGELDITVNELLSGERVSEEDYRRKAEENMVNLVKEAQESKKNNFISNGGNVSNCCSNTIICGVRSSCNGRLVEDSFNCVRYGSNYNGYCDCLRS